MYGVILIAKIVAFANAPPLIVLKKPNKEFESDVKALRASVLSPGTGIIDPNLNTINKRIVYKIFFLRSGIFQAFFNV